MAERVDDGVLRCGFGFCGIVATPGHRKTLLTPEVTTHEGECIAEGRRAFAIPGTGGDGSPFGGAEPGQARSRGRTGRAGRAWYGQWRGWTIAAVFRRPD